MLLLVVEADFDQRRDLRQRVFAGLVEEFYDRRIDMAPVGGDLIGPRTGQVAALMASMPRSGADVIGIEQIGIVRVKRLISRTVLAEQELLKEPGGVGAVPFRWACVRHRLDQLVFR